MTGSTSEPAIRVRQLGKEYQLGAHEPGGTTFREFITRTLSSPMKRFRELAGRGEAKHRFWALRDVSFDVQPGEVLGIVGRNGAGKSTLLKVLSRIVQPTEGRVELNGRVASLLEVGTGFHPELTGRENIFLNGAILGMSQAEIRRKLDEIVEFSGVAKFIDTPIKRYSSGMTVRLAFAVAAHLEPEILIIDEVLAVGDFEFQNKCLGKMKDVARSGRTILFVSHNLPAVQALCTRAILLHQGHCRLIGDTDAVIAAHIEQDGPKTDCWERPADRKPAPIFFQEIAARCPPDRDFRELQIEVTLDSDGDFRPAFLAVDVLDSSKSAIMQAIPRTDGFVAPKSGPQRYKLTVQLPALIPGTYYISLWAGPAYTVTYDLIEEAAAFTISKSPIEGRSFPHSRNHGFLVPASEVTSSRDADCGKGDSGSALSIGR
jgi:lipopolysaccharide transport system ATP-binding protein